VTIDLNDAGPQLGPAFAVEHWAGVGYVIVNNNAILDCDPEDGLPDYWGRIFAHGFRDARIAARWLAVFNLILRFGKSSMR
jgi:hypothetical protein